MTRQDVATGYRQVPEDFVKHLLGTLGIVMGLVLLASILFSYPEKSPLTIRSYATAHPVAFEQVVLRALDGQGQIANYGPPYNHGTGSVQSSLQSWAGVLHPINAATDFVLKPLGMAASINPAIGPALADFRHASASQQTRWEQAATTGLARATLQKGQVVMPRGQYGPLPVLLNAALGLGKSGLMSGALTRNPAVFTHFNTQNDLLFLQGAPLQTNPGTQTLAGPNWGIIHPAVNGYPAAWWMTIPTWIYQWPAVANSAAPDALALMIGFVFWAMLAFTPWIPLWNRVPRFVGIHRLIWQEYYRTHPGRRARVLREREVPRA